MIRNTFLIITAMIAFFCVNACAPRHTVAPPSSGLPSPEYVLRKIRQKDQERTGLQGTAKLTVDAPNCKYARKIAIIVKRPAYLRLEAIPYFGTPDFLLSVNDGILKVFLPGENRFYIGRSTKETLFSFFRIMLDATEIIPILTGTVPPMIPGDARLNSKMTESRYRIDATNEGNIFSSLWVDLEDETVKRITLYDSHGNTRYSAAYEDYRYIGKALFPHKIVITMEKPKKMQATIRYSHVQPMQGDHEELFDLPIPEGIQPIVIE